MSTFPQGWFVVAWSRELGPEGVMPLRYFGRDLVLFRTEQGPAVLDAFCPHLGAHLGHGGCVEGNAIKCPFHAWRFNAAGECVDIPYATKVPKQATLRPWPVVERNGAIFVWHCEQGSEPGWEVPTITEYGTEEWTPWRDNCLNAVKTHPREIVENVADSAHFPVVHRTEVSHFENRYEDHKATQITHGVAKPPQGGTDSFQIEATYFGPAFQISHMQGVLESILLLAHTPIDEGHLDLRFAVSLERTGPRTEQFAEFYAENLRLGFHEDIQIWENKVFRERPRICEGDGPIGRLRTWYRQFYERG